MLKTIAWDLAYVCFIGLGCIGLKLTGFVDLPWVWVLSPFWLFGVTLVLVFAAGAVLGYWKEMRRDK